jgi:hypothetical protein
VSGCVSVHVHGRVHNTGGDADQACRGGCYC